MLEWAEKCSVPVSGIVTNGRRATIQELKDVTAAIPGHTCRVWYDQNKIQINIESMRTVTFPCEGDFKNSIAPGLGVGPATFMQINGAARPTGEIESMRFHGDYELLVTIVQKLTKPRGPQVYFADCDGIPWLVVSSDAEPIGPET